MSISRACDGRKRQEKESLIKARVVFGDSSPFAKAPIGRPSKTTDPQIGVPERGQCSLLINAEHVLVFTIFIYLGDSWLFLLSKVGKENAAEKER